FDESAVRDMGRGATGVIGIRLEKGDFVIGALVIKRTSTVMVVTDKGYGKRSDVNDYRVTNRGGKGVITVKTTDKTGKLMAMMELNDNDELVCMTSGGMVIKMSAKDIRTMGRNTQGVRVINLKDNDSITDIAKVVPDDEEGEAELL
ncbi:MAG: DNA gyrase subunit A, partial [Chlorobiota bacterium]